MYQDLEPEDFKAAYENAENAVLIDVRAPQEVAQNSIEGHVLINIMDPSFPTKIQELDKDKNYFVYCRSGNRSGQACKYMAGLGFKHLTNLKGGMLAWELAF